MVASKEGKIRIYKTDAAETYKTMLYEARTESLDVSTDKRQMQTVPASQVAINQDDKLIVEFLPDATGNVNNTSILRIPMRHHNTQTGQNYDTELTLADMTATLTAADISYPAGVWGRLAYYKVGAQDAIKLGKANGDNSQIYVTLTATA